MNVFINILHAYTLYYRASLPNDYSLDITLNTIGIHDLIKPNSKHIGFKYFVGLLT